MGNDAENKFGAAVAVWGGDSGFLWSFGASCRFVGVEESESPIPRS